MEERICPCGNAFKPDRGNVAKGGGKYCSRACYWQYASHARGEDKSQWKGEAAGYKALHDWVRREKGEPERCESCGTTQGRLEWANASGQYRRDLDDWIALCRTCHRRHDSPTCKRGHERTAENTYVDRQGYPHCRPCRNERLRRQRAGEQTEPPRRSAIKDRFGKW